jgi:hypothetical protein
MRRVLIQGHGDRVEVVVEEVRVDVEGHRGRGVPEHPLPKPSPRERALWKELWRTPQAAMWAVEPWRIYVMGMYCRWAVRAESPNATADLVTQVHRIGDQIGLTPAGMKENGGGCR